MYYSPVRTLHNADILESSLLYQRVVCLPYCGENARTSRTSRRRQATVLSGVQYFVCVMQYIKWSNPALRPAHDVLSICLDKKLAMKESHQVIIPDSHRTRARLLAPDDPHACTMPSHSLPARPHLQHHVPFLNVRERRLLWEEVWFARIGFLPITCALLRGLAGGQFPTSQ